jgi:hypothetical protein
MNGGVSVNSLSLVCGFAQGNEINRTLMPDLIHPGTEVFFKNHAEPLSAVPAPRAIFQRTLPLCDGQRDGKTCADNVDGGASSGLQVARGLPGSEDSTDPRREGSEALGEPQV